MELPHVYIKAINGCNKATKWLFNVQFGITHFLAHLLDWRFFHVVKVTNPPFVKVESTFNFMMDLLPISNKAPLLQLSPIKTVWGDGNANNSIDIRVQL